MKNLTRWTLAGALAALVVMPGRAEAQTPLYTGEACGGTSFEFCANVELSLHTNGTDYWFMLTVTNLDSDITCSFGDCVVDGDVFTRIGLINLPSGVDMPWKDGTRFVKQDAGYFITYEQSSIQEGWEYNGNQGLSGNNAYGAGNRIAYNTINGINAGIADDGAMTFRFNVVQGSMTLAQMEAVGWGIHAQGYGLEDCSSKMGGTSAGVIDSESEDDGLNCAPVPEPGTNALLAIGMVGLAFVAVRRRSLSELLG